MKLFLLGPLLVLASVTVAFAAKVPALKSQVNDYANCIPENKEVEIRNYLAAQEAQTSNQVVILTIQSLEGESIEGYASKVFNTWKLGDAKKNNGVLIVQSTGDRKMRIEVGDGLQVVLTDALASQIIKKEMTPPFKKEDFGSGHMAAAQSVTKAIAGEYTKDIPWKVICILIGSLIIVVFFIVNQCLPDPDKNSPVSRWGNGGSGGGGGYSGGGGSSSGGGASGSY